MYAMKNVYSSLYTFSQLADFAKKSEWPKPKQSSETEGEYKASEELSTGVSESESQILANPFESQILANPYESQSLANLSESQILANPTQAPPNNNLGNSFPSTPFLANILVALPSRCEIRAAFYTNAILQQMKGSGTISNINNNSTIIISTSIASTSTTTFTTSSITISATVNADANNISVTPPVSELLFDSTVLRAPLSSAKVSIFPFPYQH
jgi:hypothetical protein